MAEAFFKDPANGQLASCAATIFGEVASEGEGGASRFGPLTAPPRARLAGFNGSQRGFARPGTSPGPCTRALRWRQ